MEVMYNGCWQEALLSRTVRILAHDVRPFLTKTILLNPAILWSCHSARLAVNGPFLLSDPVLLV